nr:hypothetical protein [Kibdelosporangium sp. MJ126-NF4]CTQ92837.1 hypothetical protein [Kibdelosporangium sp. MJ126-NF4]
MWPSLHSPQPRRPSLRVPFTALSPPHRNSTVDSQSFL